MTEPKTAEVKVADVPASALEAIAHNLCSLHDFDVDFVMGQERFAKAVITEYLRAAPSHIGEAAGMVAPAQSGWLRSDSGGQSMLYTLRQDGWRKGEPIMVNDATVSVRVDPRSDTPLEPIVQAIHLALSAPGSPAEKGEGSMMVKYRKDAIPFDCPYPSVGVRGGPYGYNIDPGAGSAMDRLQRHWPDREQVRDLRARDGEVTPLFPLYTHPASDQSDTERMRAAANALVNEFAWSAVKADCEEARINLQSLIDALRAALAEKEAGQ